MLIIYSIKFTYIYIDIICFLSPSFQNGGRTAPLARDFAKRAEKHRAVEVEGRRPRHVAGRVPLVKHRHLAIPTDLGILIKMA